MASSDVMKNAANELITGIILWVPVVLLLLAFGALLHYLSYHPHLWHAAGLITKAVFGAASLLLIGVFVGSILSVFSRR